MPPLEAKRVQRESWRASIERRTCVCVCEEEEEEEEEEREAKENGSLKIFYNYEFDIPFSAH